MNTQPDLVDMTRDQNVYERFRVAFAHASVGLAVTTLEGRFVEVNAAYSSIIGYTREEILAGNLLAMVHPEDKDRSVHFLTRMLQGEIPDFEIEKRYLRKDGRTVWIHASVSIARNATGHPLNIIAIIQDITQRKAAEEELRRQKELYESILLAQGTLGVGFIVAENWQATFISDALCRITGYTKAQLFALPHFHSLVVPEQRTLLQDRYERRMRGEAVPEHYEVSIIHRNGGKIELEVSVRMLNESARLIAIIRDVTEQNRSSRSLRESEEMFRWVSEAMPQIIWIVDGTGSSGYCNAAWFIYTGQKGVKVLLGIGLRSCTRMIGVVCSSCGRSQSIGVRSLRQSVDFGVSMANIVGFWCVRYRLRDQMKKFQSGWEPPLTSMIKNRRLTSILTFLHCRVKT